MAENRNILVIDDEIDLCEGIKRALQLEGFQVDLATEGTTGLEKVVNGDYALVLIDVMMPDINGIDLITSIHAVDPEIVCIIITGYGTVELAVKAIKQGAYDFLNKPFSLDHLFLTVRQGLERRQLSLEAKRANAAEAEAQRLAAEKAELEALDQAKRQFIRLVTHELQSPISAIENYITLILDGYIPAEQQPEIWEKCMLRTQEEHALIVDLLELGHLEVIETFKTEAVSLEKSLRAVVAAFQEQITQKKLQLEIQVGIEIPEIIAAPEQIKSLWNNLICNAIKYTPENGSITIYLNLEQNRIIGRITDTGIGISSEDQGQIFTEFFRARNAKNLNLPGTGLGLAIVKRIVDGLQGEIQVESQIGKGSTFTFSIPTNG